jgi:serine/threonine protein kinase
MQSGRGEDVTVDGRVAAQDDATRTSDATLSANASSSPFTLTRARDDSRYEIIAEHGRGGLGRVFRARDKELGRDVAIKELLRRDTHAEYRFFREALITSRLEHPGIVPVHEAGRWSDGTPFYSMKLVSGTSLAELIQGARSWEERRALVVHVAAVADAMAYAHSKRIIHRDLKPSNVIVGGFGETIVIDWGLAKSIDDADDEGAGTDSPSLLPGLTAAGAVLGTPAYMAPEQAHGLHADERADIYALGQMLIHVVTGTLPAVRGSREDTVLATMIGDRELASIAVRATQADPSRRYATARDLADDLRRYSSGELVHAHKYANAELLARWARTHAALLAIGLLAFIGIAVVATVGASRLSRANEQVAAPIVADTGLIPQCD